MSTLAALRFLALAATRGDMEPREFRMFLLLASAGALCSAQILRWSVSGGLRGPAKAILALVTLHAARRHMRKLLMTAFPTTLQSGGLLEGGEGRGDPSAPHVFEHKLSLRLLQSSLDLAVKLNVKGVECMEVQWSFGVRDVGTAPCEAGASDGPCALPAPPSPTGKRVESLLGDVTGVSWASDAYQAKLGSPEAGWASPLKPTQPAVAIPQPPSQSAQ